ncbi:MAG: hypothetical protein HKN76_01045 [Saprospiraceae bacterium]|nr:hypothetical protein [Saprospiraceae bacterium]
MKKLLIVLFWLVLTYLVAIYVHWFLSFLTPLIFIPWLKLDLLRSLLLGFLVIFIVWFSAAVILNLRNTGVLAEMISGLVNVSSPLLLLATGFIGGFGGALTSWLAYVMSTPYKLVDSSRNDVID